MDKLTIAEEAYKRGYEKGLKDAVKHGRWEIVNDEYDCEMMRCSCCGEEFYDGDNDTVDCQHNYCPNCGAKMDGGAEDGRNEV